MSYPLPSYSWPRSVFSQPVLSSPVRGQTAPSRLLSSLLSPLPRNRADPPRAFWAEGDEGVAAAMTSAVYIYIYIYTHIITLYYIMLYHITLVCRGRGGRHDLGRTARAAGCASSRLRPFQILYVRKQACNYPFVVNCFMVN